MAKKENIEEPKKEEDIAKSPKSIGIKQEDKVFITREQVISCKTDIKSEDVPVPEWATEDQDPGKLFIHVVGMDGNRRDVYQNMMENARKKSTIDLKTLTTKFVIAVCLDPETGKPLFNDSDIAVLQAKSAKPMDRIMQVGQRLSGMAQESIKELIENLGGTLSGSTGSN